MFRPTFLATSLLLFSSSALGQAASTDSQTLQALLGEVRQLRQDLQTVAIAARRSQVLIYRIYNQEAVVGRISQRLDESKSTLVQLQFQKRYHAAQIKKYEDLTDHAENTSERKQFEDAISEMKTRMDESVPQEQELQSKEAELEEELRMELAKLSRLQDELDRLDKALEDSSRQGSKQP